MSSETRGFFFLALIFSAIIGLFLYISIKEGSREIKKRKEAIVRYCKVSTKAKCEEMAIFVLGIDAIPFLNPLDGEANDP